MIKTSHIQKMRHILRDMRRPPEEGTNDATKNYKKVTPGQDEEIEEHCGVCDEQGIEEKRVFAVLRKHKENFAKDGRDGRPNLLIDDHEQNIADFKKRGGLGIHHINARNTIKELKKLGYK